MFFLKIMIPCCKNYTFIVATRLMCKQSCVTITIWEMEIIIDKHLLN